MDHLKTMEKLKKFHGDEKHKLEQQVNSLKENGATKESLRGTIKDAARCMEPCM